MKILLIPFLLIVLLVVVTPVKAQSHARSRPQLHSQPQSRSQARLQSRSQSRSQARPQSRSQARSQPQPQSPPQSGTAYITDLVEVPLRAGASNRHKITGSARSGSAVQIVKAEAAKGYTLIRTSSGAKGWIPASQLSSTPSSREQLTGVREELDQLKTEHSDLKQHLDETADKPEGESKSYTELYEEALRLRQQLAQYRMVATDTVAIDDRNKALQERAVVLERDLQVTQQENAALRNDNNTIRLLMGAVLLGAFLLVAVLAPRIREQRRAKWNQL